MSTCRPTLLSVCVSFIGGQIRIEEKEREGEGKGGVGGEDWSSEP